MRRISRSVISLAAGAMAGMWSGGVLAETQSDLICRFASAFMAKNGVPVQNGLLLFAEGDYPNGNWTQNGFASKIVIAPQSQQVFLAYFIARPFSAAGAVSAKISRKIERKGQATNYVDVYRPPIAQGTNSCERRGRGEIDRRVRVNQYIDYHDGNGTNSTLEDFHFQYPQGSNCIKTDEFASRSKYQFDDVKPTEGDTFVARNFSLVGTAYAVGHEFAMLRSELHYRADAAQAGTCVGISVPIGRSPEASVVVTERGFGNFPGGRPILIGR